MGIGSCPLRARSFGPIRRSAVGLLDWGRIALSLSVSAAVDETLLLLSDCYGSIPIRPDRSDVDKS